jgi:AraC-like DNA-binding protein
MREAHAAVSKSPNMTDFSYASRAVYNLITVETSWRTPIPGGSTDTIAIARWQSQCSRPAEFSSRIPVDCHVAEITLRNMDMRLLTGDRIAHDGPLAAGSFTMAKPMQEAKCFFRGPYDMVHLFVPNRIVEECAADFSDGAPVDSTSHPIQDAGITYLARSLVLSGQENCREILDHITMAMITRILFTTRRAGVTASRGTGGLPRWRLKRAIDYVEENLDQPVTLADVASAAGLSRMHFAAQFKKSTGQRPHQYVLSRRIERAQELLATTDMAIVEVALSVGFQAQSHFTTIFKRVVGEPPHCWRRHRPALARSPG